MADKDNPQQNRPLAFGIGIALGAGMGVAFGNVGIGIAIGLALGVVLSRFVKFPDDHRGDAPKAGGGDPV